MAIQNNKYILQNSGCAYITPQAAKNTSGIRVVLTVGAFNPWGQAVKKMLEYKGLQYIAVGQHAGEPNDELVAWTGARNAPIIVHDQGPPIIRWLDQIIFIENLQPSPGVLPQNSELRAITFGICNELAGEWGLGWCRRLMLLNAYESSRQGAGESVEVEFKTVMDAYGYGVEKAEAAPQRISAILHMIASRLKSQKAIGSDFLVGHSLTAADIYWASFSNMIEPLPDDLCPIPPEMRQDRTPRHPAIIAAKAQILMEHRDRIFRSYLGRVEF
jgi:glutathione S-transferase